MNFKKININKLKAALYNPRKDLKPDDAEYQKIKRSIETFGYIEPIIINKDFTVVGGHQRLKVLKELDYGIVDCVIVDLDKTEEKALNIALNKISGEWDMQSLKDLLQDLDTGEIDMELTGYYMEEIEMLMNQFHQNNDEENIKNMLKEFKKHERDTEPIKDKNNITKFILTAATEVFTAEIIKTIKSLYEYGIEIEMEQNA